MDQLINEVSHVSIITVFAYALSQAGALTLLLFATKKPLIKAIKASGLFDKLIFEQITELANELSLIKQELIEIRVRQLAVIAFDERYTCHERIQAVDEAIGHGYDGSLVTIQTLLREQMKRNLMAHLAGDAVVSPVVPVKRTCSDHINRCSKD